MKQVTVAVVHVQVTDWLWWSVHENMEKSESKLSKLLTTIAIDSSSDAEDSSSKVGKNAKCMLPPCRVCGDRASGFHFGANTCEACKKFFRHSLKRNSEYQCARTRECVIDLSRRASCSFCRLQKCLLVGMAKEASKTGRYTLAKKNQNIREIKQLERTAFMKDAVWAARHLEETQALVTRLVAVHRRKLPFTPELFASIPQKEKEFLEYERLQSQVFGTMGPVTRDDYMKLHDMTGIDLGDRGQQVQSAMLFLEDNYHSFVELLKCVPYFEDLHVDDQIALVKAARADTWMLWYYPCVNLKLGLWMMPWGSILKLDDMRAMAYDEELFQLKLCCMRRLQNLNLTYEENVLLGCVAFMASDGAGITNRDLVEKGQWQLVEALQHLLFDSHRDRCNIVLASSLSVLTELRSISHLHDKELEKWKEFWRDKIKVPPLIEEVWQWE